eukprot:gene7131-7198_t
MANNPWYTIDNVNELDTPALVIYPDRIKQNISLLTGMIDDVSRLRPHVKTHKCAEVTKLLLDAGISKFKCATIAEAEMLASSGAKNILLAYQPVGEKVNRLGELIVGYPFVQFSCLVDQIDAANVISEAAVRNEVLISVFIDLNIGQNRTGVSPDEKALKLYQGCAHLPGIKPVGLHAYDGHLNDPDINKRTQQCDICFEPVAKLQRDLIDLGYEPIIVAGGSPTFPVHAKRPGGIECSPGTFIYWDRGYQINLSEQPFLTAALVVSRIISLPDESKVCFDVGHKSIGAENELNKRIYFLNGPELRLISQSEEHLVADAGAGHGLKVGDVFYGLPHHVCPTVALYERAITIESGKISGEWKTIARDRKITV